MKYLLLNLITTSSFSDFFLKKEAFHKQDFASVTFHRKAERHLEPCQSENQIQLPANLLRQTKPVLNQQNVKKEKKAMPFSIK